MMLEDLLKCLKLLHGLHFSTLTIPSARKHSLMTSLLVCFPSDMLLPCICCEVWYCLALGTSSGLVC